MDEKAKWMTGLLAIVRLQKLGLDRASGVGGCLDALHAILRDACVAAGAFRYSDIPLGSPLGCYWDAWETFLVERIQPIERTVYLPGAIEATIRGASMSISSVSPEQIDEILQLIEGRTEPPPLGQDLVVDKISVHPTLGRSMRLSGLTAEQVAAVGVALLGDSPAERARWLSIWEGYTNE